MLYNYYFAIKEGYIKASKSFLVINKLSYLKKIELI